MEKWQESLIRINRHRLIEITRCTPELITVFYGKGLLSKDDKEILEVAYNQKGKMAQSNVFYDIVTTKDNGFNILLEVFSNPAFAQQAVAKLLIKEAKLSSQPIRNGNVADGIAPASSSYFGNGHSQPVQLPQELEDFLRNGKELEVQVKKPDPQSSSVKTNYSLPPKGLGYAFILNIIEIEGQLTREGAEKDTDYMVKLLEGLGYKIFPKKKLLYGGLWTKQTIEEELDKFKYQCIQDAVDSIVVFFGSHGYKDHLLSSDGEMLDVQAEIIYPLQFGKVELGKPVAKIFIDETCRIDPPHEVHIPASLSLPSCEDTIHIQAQMPKYKANRDADCGSYFVIVLAYVLMNKAWNTTLQEMLEETQDLLRRMSFRAGADCFQISPFTMGLHGPFYFFTR